MTPTEVLRFIKSQHPKVWRAALPGQADSLRSLLGVGKDVLNDPAVTRHVTGANTSSVIETLLASAERQERVAARFGLPDLFRQADKTALEAMLLRMAKTAPAGPARVDRSDFNELAAAKLGPHEHHAIKNLLSWLTNAGRPVVTWFAPFDQGARFCIHSLVTLAGFKDSYDQLFVIRPSDKTEPFTSELRSIGQALRVTPSEQHAATLLDGLRTHRSLLVLCGAQGWSRHGDLARELLAEARRRGRGWTGPAALMVVGANEELAAELDWASDITAELSRCLAVPGPSRMQFFQSQWTRFCQLRGIRPEREIGARLYHAQWHYDGLAGGNVWPINMRLRAYFASNLDNQAFFDPTAGFDALAGPPELPLDILLFREDVSDYLSALPAGRQNHETQLLQFMSTAKFWLTRDALEVLGRVSGNNEPSWRGMSPVAVRKCLLTLSPPIAETGEGSSGKRSFVLGIGVRAIVQDAWKRSGPGSRSLAHYRIAERLFTQQNDKVLLGAEFPFVPHYGRSRMYFISECIRHLVRASDAVTSPDRLVGPGILAETPFGVDPPTRDLQACDPRQAITFCYRILYRRELDGRHSAGGQTRLLAKRHGAYSLAFELLQLMSDGGRFGVPHWALDPELHREFRVDAGFAALNVGELELAEACFDRLIASDREQYAALRTDENARQLAEAQLSLALVHASQDRLQDARTTIDAAVDTIGGVIHLDNARPSVRRRVTGRLAHLSYLDGDLDTALGLFNGLVNDEGGITDPDLMHCYIALLEKVRARPGADLASIADGMDVCVSSMFSAMSDGLQHDAMGFKIALAHIMRKRGSLTAAETIMDSVHRDILQFGCSERTHLSFTLEAARILLGRNKPVRAFACYAEPCLRRAEALGFRRVATSARQTALASLNRARKILDTVGRDEWRRLIQKELDDDLAYRTSATSVSKGLKERERLGELQGYADSGLQNPPGQRTAGPFSRGPLYAYTIAEAKEIMLGLSTFGGIDKAIAEVKTTKY